MDCFEHSMWHRTNAWIIHANVKLTLHYKVISRKHISAVIHNYSLVMNVHNVQKTICVAHREVDSKPFCCKSESPLTFYIFWQGKIGQRHWTLFIIHINGTSPEQKRLIRQVRTWLMASCFPDLSYLTSSFQAAGADVPQLSRMSLYICVWIAYSQPTDKPFDFLALEQVSVDVSQKPCCDKGMR